ncbi:hypothetical protein [Methanosarcina sp. UBA289]|uniref:hypothetical protein n=1 Tax=Methanosarcina sp. UBA289 TaxID=1915574 RepID=UPI0025F3713A|nr:hypothetical protein [Methanosarcina sp. UBA289]
MPGRGLIVDYYILSEDRVFIGSAGENYFFFADPVTIGLEEFVYFLFDGVSIDEFFSFFVIISEFTYSV